MMTKQLFAVVALVAGCETVPAPAPAPRPLASKPPAPAPALAAPAPVTPRLLPTGRPAPGNVQARMSPAELAK